MLGKKLILSAMASGLLWAAGWAGQAVVADHPGMQMVAGQIRLSLGDKEGGLRLMARAAQQEQAAPQNADDAAVAAPAPAPAKCAKQVASRRPARSPLPARLVTVKVEVPSPGYASKLARRQFEVVRLSLEQARLGEQMRARVMQQMHDLPAFPTVPREPVANTP